MATRFTLWGIPGRPAGDFSGKETSQERQPPRLTRFAQRGIMEPFTGRGSFSGKEPATILPGNAVLYKRRRKM